MGIYLGSNPINIEEPVDKNDYDDLVKIIDRTISGTYVNNNVTNIRWYAFAKCSALTSVSFPNCTSISAYAFQYCSALTSVSFPSCTSIGYSAFQYCSTLTSVSFPNCTSMSNNVFANCSALTSVFQIVLV